NEKDIVNQHIHKSIGEYYDSYDYIIEKSETTIKCKKAIQILPSNDGLLIFNCQLKRNKSFNTQGK
ncbi:hypothetical protein P9430_20430, partial [Citrobacter freundii]